ncbi:MAG: N(4)-(beta-N-acetylglucosaminyl)-L-asparaginase [Phycisphaerales bacterium]|jgi:isoaspartyl peptidase/L-asparaginase-like protein (Ntn-hydrolase superfamily)|nr:N(4)-(beta-N-acetylglucosaminyl)-L-asparaginase [Phycisphaerales bacterium]
MATSAHTTARRVAPIVISTWSFGPVANAAAWPILASGGSSLDAVVAGATAVEDDPTVDSVGVGGFPDASGHVSLDACVMQAPDRCGGVCYLRHYAGAARLARAVMDKTIHVLLAGDGAEAFAQRQGFTPHPTHLLTPEARAAWEAWRTTHDPSEAGQREGVLPPMNVEERYRDARATPSDKFRHAPGAREGNHDTVCLLGIDHTGVLSGCVTTSGLGFKVPGRVGDSPIIGHGLYVDQTAGAAAATGNGELIMGVCGSFLAVELMRAGRTPLEACLAVLDRIISSYAIMPQHQVALIALAPDGRWGAASLKPGFSCCITTPAGQHQHDAQHVMAPRFTS